MRIEPHARGACHRPNYWANAQILSPDVDRSHSIPMPGEPAFLVRAVEHTPLWLALALMPTNGTGFRGVAFLLEGYHHAKPFSLVREHVTDTPMRPLVECLVLLGANIQILPDSSNVANDYSLHALLMERGNEP